MNMNIAPGLFAGGKSLVAEVLMFRSLMRQSQKNVRCVVASGNVAYQYFHYFTNFLEFL